MPAAGTLVFNTLSSKTEGDAGVGVGVAAGVGVGVGVALANVVPEFEPPHDHEPAMETANKTIHSLPTKRDRCVPTLIMRTP
jgi:hypothetical protein